MSSRSGVGILMMVGVFAWYGLGMTSQVAEVSAQVPRVVVAEELAWVPADAMGFVHVRVADIWNNDLMKDSRLMMQKAGPKAILALDQQFVPKPSTIDRVTVFALLDPEKFEPEPVSILTFTEAFDQEKILQSYFAKAKKTDIAGKTVFVDTKQGLAVHFPNRKTIVVSSAEFLPKYMAKPVKAEGELKAALDLAKSGKAMVASFNLKSIPLPSEFTEGMPQEALPLLNAKSMLMSMDMTSDMKMKLQVTCADAADAKKIEKALRDVAEMGRGALQGEPKMMAEQMLFKPAPRGQVRPLEELPEAIGGVMMLAAINYADELLANLPVKTDGASVAFEFTVPEFLRQYVAMAGLGAGVALPAVQKVRASSQEMQSKNNMKQIGLAMHNYHDAMGTFPPAAICDKNGKPLLSWRVAILPYIEQDNLYRQFKLDEPWDSEHNLPLSKTVVKAYSDPRATLEGKDANKTYYKVFVGKDAAFLKDKGRKFLNFTDGLSNTIMVAAGGEPVIWSKPEDFDFDPKAKLPDLKGPFDRLLIGLCDGSVQTVDLSNVKNVDAVLKGFITPSGGEVTPRLSEIGK